jgi:hypothetical protein
MLLRAEQVRIGQMTGADLGQDLAPRRHRLGLERFGRRGGEDLRRDEPPKQILQRDQVHHGDLPGGIGGEAEPASIAAVLEAVVRIADGMLHRADVESLPIRGLGPDRAVAGAQHRPLTIFEAQLDLGRRP